MSEDIEHRVQNVGLVGSMTLLRELQHAFYEIARQAELAGSGALPDIQARAEQALRLVDSCIISAQVEVGQLQLNLSPYGLGAIMHEAAHELRYVTGYSIDIRAGANQPVMTHAEMLKNMLYSAGSFMYDSVKSPVLMRSFAAKNGDVGVGVFAKGFTITPKDLQKARNMSEATYMPMAQHTQRSGVMLLLADALAQSLGSELQVKRLGRYKGFAAVLPKSQQLALVAG